MAGGKDKSRGLAAYIKRQAFIWEMATLFAAFLVSRVSIMNGLSPFSSAFLAACAIARVNVHYALFGCILGSFARVDGFHIAGACVSTLFYILNWIWSKLKRDCGTFERLILLALSQLALTPMFFGGGLPEILRGFISLAVAVLGAMVIQNALRTLRSVGRRHVLTDGEQLSVSAFFGLVLLGVSDVAVFGFSLAVALLLLYAMVAALSRGVSGVAVAVALAMVLTIGGDFTLAFVGGIAACALAGAMLRSLDALGVLGGFVGCSLLVGTHVFTASHTINLINLGAAGLAFVLIPKEQMLRLCAFLDADKDRERYTKKAMKRMRACSARELTHTSAVCRELGALYQPEELEPEPTDAFLQWIAQAAYSACADCPLKYLCWKDWKRASESVLTLLQSLERGERIRVRKPFDPSCRQMQQLAGAAWQAQNQYLVQRAMKKQTAQHYAFVNRQLTSVSDVLEALSGRILREQWLDEELEGALFRGLDRRGYRISGAEASYPYGRLRVEIRVATQVLCETESFLKAVQGALKREMRLLQTQVDGRMCSVVLEEAQQLSAEMGAAGAAISASGVSGDSIGERRMERGRVLYALSDGMGAGEEAKGESDLALKMLFDLYDAGFSRDVALESVNRLLLERKRDMYATLDAVFLDLRSGEAEFMKYGAPSSYVYRSRLLHEVRAEALPAGIVDEAVPAISKAKLRRNDALVLLTDGALDALGESAEQTIQSALASSRSSEEAAAYLLERACEREQADDMTVMVIRIA